VRELGGCKRLQVRVRSLRSSSALGHPPAAKRWTLGWRAPRGGPRGCAALWEATADLLHGWHSRHVAECLPRRLPAPAAQTLTSCSPGENLNRPGKPKARGEQLGFRVSLPRDNSPRSSYVVHMQRLSELIGTTS